MSGPIAPIPQFPIFVWPENVPQLDFVWTKTGTAAVPFSVAAGSFVLLSDYTGATKLEDAIEAAEAAASTQITTCKVVYSSGLPRFRIVTSEGGTLQMSAVAAKYLGFAVNGASYTATFPVDGGIVTGGFCPFGYWQPLSRTPWYERHGVAQAFVSESIGGGYRYRTEWGTKQAATFSASNVRRGMIYRDAVNVKGTGTPIDGTFSAAAGKAVGDDNNTLERMIEAARYTDILTLLAGNYKAGVSIVNADILSDMESIIAETDGKRMYDVTIPFRHIGFV